MFSNCEKFDFSSMELVGMYVKDYKVLKNQCFSLHPLYKVNMIGCGKINVETIEPEPIDFFRKYNLNVKVFCGKNGTGKSSIIDILKGIKPSTRECATFIYVDKNGCVGVTKDNVAICFKNEDISFIRLKENVNELYGTNLDNGIDNGTFNIGEDIIATYLDNREIFDFENDGPLFDHFEIALRDMDENSFSENLSQILFENYSKYGNTRYVNAAQIKLELKELCKSKLLYIVLLYEFLSYNDDDEHLLSQIFNHNVQYLIDFLNKNLNGIEEANDEIVKLFTNRYSLNEYDVMGEKIREICENFYLKNQHNFTNHVLEHFFFRPFRYYGGTSCEKRYFGDLSDGQCQMIFLRYRLYKSLAQMDDQQGYRLTLDEPEDKLHPEWARGFWSMFVEQFNIVKDLTKKYFIENNQEWRAKLLETRFISLIVSTHSPFLLSDLAPQNVIALERMSDGRTVIKEIRSTFAGNIAEMFYENFFLNSTIGELAEKEIQHFIENVENKNISKENALKFVDIIGDDFLRKLLIRKVERCINEKN